MKNSKKNKAEATGKVKKYSGMEKGMIALMIFVFAILVAGFMA